MRVNRKPGSPSSVRVALYFLGSTTSHVQPSITIPTLSPDPGFTITVWMFPLVGSQGTILSKTTNSGNTRIYTLRVLSTSIHLDYRPAGTSSGYKTVSVQAAVRLLQWSHVAVTVYQKNVAFYVNGRLARTATLQGAISDGNGDILVGQVVRGSSTSAYKGQMQELYIYTEAVSERSIQEIYSGSLPSLSKFHECRCPPSHPLVDTNNELICTTLAGHPFSMISRINQDAHPVEYANDPDSLTRWQSELGQQVVNMTIDFKYGEVEVLYMIAQFYTPRPKAMVFEKSLDGHTFTPLQYYADDCPTYFGLPNDDGLTTSTDVNCITTQSRQLPSSLGQVSYRLLDPNRPDVVNYNQLPALRQLAYSSSVRLRMIDYFTSQTEARHLYYGIMGLRVLGRCECNGHATECVGNETQHAWVCTCQHHTTGHQCSECEALYNSKPWRRGTTSQANPCLPCECNDHATSCHYISTIDPFPNSQTSGGGGVCDECTHNTTGIHCDKCIIRFYRPSGRRLNATDVCVPCNCHSPGVVGGDRDCVKDDSNSAVLAGQCHCKQFVTGRQCDLCQDGYYNLDDNNPQGCVKCGCNVNGTVASSGVCNQVSGQCLCKRNVMGMKCDQCQTGTHSLSLSNPEGCVSCNCNPMGTLTGSSCNVVSGQCQCKAGVTGLKCDQCLPGFYNLSSSGCDPCQCDSVGVLSSSGGICDQSTGQCQCKANVMGLKCDMCAMGFFIRNSSSFDSCVACGCNTNGTVAASPTCSSDGLCMCKALVTGQKCDSCVSTAYGLSAANPQGCTSCSCSSRGTVSGSACDSVSGQCQCLPNVLGRACDLCSSGFYMAPNDQKGCLACNCHPQGSRGSLCHPLTGQCSCLFGVGIAGRACDLCAAGYFGFTGTSCQTCGCNTAGSTSISCHQTSGQCNCKQYVEGIKCDRCISGYSSLQDSNPFGCSAPPEEQGPPTLVALNGTAARVSWQPPEKPQGQIIFYLVIRNGTVVFNTTLTTYTDTGVLPITTYEYRIQAHTIAGSTISAATRVKTLEGAPGVVTPPRLSVVGPSSIVASWSVPAMPNGQITEYVLIQLLSNGRDVTVFRGSNLHYTITGLVPFTQYSYKLRACTNAGCTESAVISKMTLEGRPAFQPAPIALTVLPMALTIGWALPPRPNGILTGFKLYNMANGNQRLIFSTTDTTMNYTTVTGLTPYTEYDYAVESSTAAGSTRSSYSSLRTGQAAPQSLLGPTVEATSASTLVVIWQIPMKPNGLIVNYSVYQLGPPDILVHQTTTTGQFTVTGLTPFTEYSFFVEVCTEVACTNSSQTRNSTFEAEPKGQTPPVIISINATTASLTWLPPAVPNGQISSYTLERLGVAFDQSSAVPGIHFEGLGYAVVTNPVFYGGFESTISFYFQTYNADGLLFYAGDAPQQDFVGIQLTNGRPYFIFNCGSGAGMVSLGSSTTFDDGMWHKLVAYRRGNSGRLTIDDTLIGTGNSPGTASVIGRNTGVQLGGVMVPFGNPPPGHTANFPVTAATFAGCIRDLYFSNAAAVVVKADLANLQSSSNVLSSSVGCPALTKPGVHFKGGGHVELSASRVGFSAADVEVSFSFRTTQQNALLFFAYGSAPSFLSLELAGGELVFQFDNGDGKATARTDSRGTRVTLCDGQWHSLRAIKQGTSGELFVDGTALTSSINAGGSLRVLTVTSNIFVGGVEAGSVMYDMAENLGIETSPFAGCVRNLTIAGRYVNMATDVTSLSSVSLAGCPDGAANFVSCAGGVPTTIFRGNKTTASDVNIRAFTEYLYRVKSSNRGGFSTSSWISVRSKEAAPTGIPQPNLSYSGGSDSIRVTWSYPSPSSGIIIQYKILLYPYHPRSQSGAPTVASPTQVVIDDAFVTERVITGLAPYTRYHVVLEASTSAGSAVGPAATVQTDEAKPVGIQVLVVMSQAHSLNFTWDEPSQPNGIILYYTLSVNGHVFFNGTKQQFLLESLTPYTDYTAQLSACNSAGCESGVVQTTSTTEAPPVGVPAATLVVQGAQTVFATWKEPLTKNGIIILYEIYLVAGPLSTLVVFNGTVRQATITNLVAGTTYSFRVKAFTSAGGTFGPSSSVRTLDDVPEGIDPPQAIALNATAVTITWNRPQKPNGNITAYVLLEDEIEVFRGLVFSYVSSGLSPYRVYEYKIQACTTKGCGTSAPASVRTLESTPEGQPTPLIQTVTSTTVQVLMGEPVKANGDVQFRLFVTGEVGLSLDRLPTGPSTFVAHTARSGTQPVVVYNLLPYSNYTFVVEVANSAGAINSTTVTAQTLPDAPYEVSTPRVTSINSTAIRAFWSPPGRLNGVLLSYLVVVESVVGTFEPMRLNNGLATEAIVNDLKPFTTYNVTVNVTTNGGAAVSAPATVTTNESVPLGLDQPTVTAVQSHYVLLDWDVPSSPNGRIIGHRVFVNGTGRRFLPGNRFTANVTGLSPFTVYLLEVEACNTAGCVFSDPVIVTTGEAAPQGLSAPFVAAFSARSVVVQWSVPSFPNGIVLFYYIQRILDNSGLAPVTVSKLSVKNLTRLTFFDSSGDLFPFTSYLYRIVAENSAGLSISPYSNVTTREAAPSGVIAPTVTPRSSTALDVTWNSPLQPNGIIVSYELKRVQTSDGQVVLRRFDANRFGTTATGLRPFTNYTFVLTACTAAGCKESDSALALTLEAPATGLNPPVVSPSTPRSPTQLFVFWDAPSQPNGELVRYELYRKNIDSASGNGTAFQRVTLTDPTLTSIVDTGLNVYSRYQYQVVFVNRAGSTRSVSSSIQRTEADTPLAGPTVSATVVNHTAVLVQWQSPGLSRLRGPVIRYDLFVKAATEAKTTLVTRGVVERYLVTSLLPNTDYEFTVVLDNGVGTATGNVAVARTLDGRPEGVRTPSVRTLGATSVRITWTEPLMPNGRILLYTVRRDGTKIYNSTVPSTFVALNLTPATNYSFTVEVCTVFDCVTSSAAAAVTFEALPRGLAAPTVKILGARSANVSWNPPRQPNGQILNYYVYRRAYQSCTQVGPTEDPSTTPTKEQCTYVECPLLLQSHCGTGCYDPSTQVCCDGVIYSIKAGFACCGANYTRRSNPTDVCCGGGFHSRQTGFGCCGTSYVSMPSGSICCDGLVSTGNDCCGTAGFDSARQICCGGMLRTAHVNLKCCGNNVVLKSKMCCDGTAYDVEDDRVCCGSQYVINSTTLCCVSTTGAARAYAYSSAASKTSSGEVCCGTAKIFDGDGCCNERSYDAVTQVCADRSTVPGSSRMCGAGTVCSAGQTDSAYCDRCDFDLNALSCATVDGKHSLGPTTVSPTALPTPTAPSLCPGVLEFVASVQTLSIVDSDLKPYTRYEFEVVAFNSIGNTSSPADSGTTLQASPQGVFAPVLATSSSSSIAITWRTPMEANGVITSYTLFRNGRQVHQSSATMFMDSGLQPFTSYTYLLEVCTVGGCTNSSSVNALTLEDKPKAVDSPIAVAVSPTTIRVQWSPPVEPNGVVINYRLYQDSSTVPVLSGLAMDYNATRLSPYTTYSFVVEACTGVGCTSSKSTLTRTLEAAPEGVKPPRLTALSPTSVDVQWETPSSPNGRILQYSLLRNESSIFNGSALNVTDTGLTPGITYGYRVRATTGGGSTVSSVSIVTTPEDVPDGLAIPKLTPVNSTAIQVQWVPPSQPNGVIIRYIVYVDGSPIPVALRTALVVDGFRPFTTHEFQVEACNGKGCARSQRTSTTTLEAPPENMRSPTVVALGPTVVQVSWFAPEKTNGIITGYEVYRRAATPGAPELIVCTSNNVSDVSCTNSDSQLQPFSTYEYRVRAENSAGNVYSGYASVRTLEAPPTGLNAPAVVVLSDSQVNASWGPPSKPNGVILSYLLRHRLFIMDVQGSVPTVAANVSSDTLHAVASNLEANTDYEFQIVAYNGAGSVQSAWQLATTQEGCPQLLQPITATADPSGTALFLTWNAPLKPNGAITSYKIYADTVYTIGSRRFDFRRLVPFTAYTFQLEACTTVCCVRGENQTIRTAEISPVGQAAPRLVANTPSQILVTWRPPSSPNGIIIRYAVYRRQPPTPGSPLLPAILLTVVNVTNASISVPLSFSDSGLLPFTTYQYGIQAENSAGSVQSPYAEVQTLQAAPQGVTGPLVVSLSSTSVSVSWIRPATPNGILSRYNIIRNGTFISSTIFTTYNDTALQPFTVYSYSVAACTAGGCTTSSTATVVTREAPPSVVFPPTLTAINSTAIYANWSHPDQPNGIILEFLIEYTGVSRRSVGLVTDLVVTNLAPFSLYAFRLTACTAGGCTTSTEATERSRPSAPEGLAPPTLNVVGSESIVVLWKVPAVPNGMIDTYRLLRNGSVVYIGKDLQFRDSGLQPGSTYGYSVVASTQGGGSTESGVTVTATNPDAPGGLLPPTVVPISSTNVTVTWQPPASPNGVIVGYQVLVDGVVTFNGSADSFGHTVTDLDSFSVHSFQIRACTSRGCSVSGSSTTRTLEAPPMGQKFPALIATSRNVSITWVPPDMPNGIIILYEVYRRPVDVGDQWTLVFNGTATFFVDADRALTPFNRYEYRVVSHNSVGSTSSLPSPVRLEESKPESIPRPSIHDIRSDAFKVNVQEPLLPNGVVISYGIAINGTLVDSDTQRNLSVSDLKPFTLYRVRGQVCTVAGCGLSDAVFVRSAEAAPQGMDPPRVTQRNRRSVVLRWAEPSEPNGIIIKYVILLRTACPQPDQPFLIANRSQCVVGELKEVSTSTAIRIDSDVFSQTIPDLRPYTTYQFLVRGENSVGSTLSPWSDIAATDVDDPEFSGTDVSVSSDSIQVRIDWSLTFYYNDRVESFTVYENRVIIFEGFTSTSIVRTGRSVGRTYTYQVSVETVSGGTAVSRQISHVFGLSTGAPKPTTRVPNVQTPGNGTKQASTPESQKDETQVTESVGFILGIMLAVLLLIFIVGALILRRKAPEADQGRRKQRTRSLYQDSSMWSRPSANEQRISAISPATSEKGLIDSELPMAWDTGVMPSDSFEDHKGFIVDPTSEYYSSSFLGEHTTFKDTHL